jgi:DNA (cytosine-5)-methyltransferase 1
MADQILLRNVPRDTQAWMRHECQRRKVSRNALMLSLLEDAMRDQQGPSLFDNLPADAPPQPERSQGKLFTFIDLFSGIGGLRLGLEAVGGRCLFSCEIDKHAQRTYHAWFGETSVEDIRDFASGKDVPTHDVLAAGFPCQPFSIAGVSKKKSLGREHGFKDKAQGTLFFHLAEIVEARQPAVLLLENVKNLRSHNKGDTWRTISEHLDNLGYRVFDRIVDAADYVPQHRERIFIVAFRKSIFGNNPPFEFPEAPEGPQPQLQDILEDEADVPDKYILTERLWQYLQDYARKHKAKGNGFGFGLANREGITRTLSARYYKDGSEILIPRAAGQRPRRLTPLEAGRLMGFPEHLIRNQVVSDTQAYRQYGNSVVPKVVEPIARRIVDVMQWQLLKNGDGCLLANG